MPKGAFKVKTKKRSDQRTVLIELAGTRSSQTILNPQPDDELEMLWHPDYWKKNSILTRGA